MAPEQASGEHPVDHRADIWSLGVILYECLSGVRPIEGENLPQVVARLMSAGIMPLERIAPELPAEVTGLVKQMLSREVARRPPSLLEVSRALSHFTNVRAPEFVAPSGVASPAPTPRTMQSARPKARVVASRDADPQGPTMLSSPPVNSSLQLAQEPPKHSRMAYAVGAAAVVLVAIAWFVSNRQPPASVQTSSGELPTLPAPPERTSPAPAAAAPSAAPVASAVPVAVESPAPSRPKSRPKPPVPAPTKSRPDANEGNLFSGRK
jgi:serine/threonine-protein kinase